MTPPPRPIAELVWKSHRTLYSATRGRLGQRFLGMRTLLLTARGRRSGRPRETALMYLEYGPALAIVASNLGSDRALDWWLNLECDPDAHVRLGAERRALRARRASPDEQALLWPRFVEMYRDYALYQRRTKRAIPIVMLEPR